MFSLFKSLLKVGLVIVLMVVGGYVWYRLAPKEIIRGESLPPRSAMTDPSAQELSDYILKMMAITKADVSPVKQKLIIRSIVNISTDTFATLAERKRFVRVIAIESKFDTSAHSSAGAIGLAQVMPQYAKEFSKDCGAEDFRESDLTYSDVNLLIGACRLKSLMALYPEGMTRVLIAYNAGTSSTQMKQIEVLANIANVETASYVVKYEYLTSLAELPLSVFTEEFKDVGRGGHKSVSKIKDSKSKEQNKN